MTDSDSISISITDSFDFDEVYTNFCNLETDIKVNNYDDNITLLNKMNNLVDNMKTKIKEYKKLIRSLKPIPPIICQTCRKSRPAKLYYSFGTHGCKICEYCRIESKKARKQLKQTVDKQDNKKQLQQDIDKSNYDKKACFQLHDKLYDLFGIHDFDSESYYVIVNNFLVEVDLPYVRKRLSKINITHTYQGKYDFLMFHNDIFDDMIPQCPYDPRYMSSKPIEFEDIEYNKLGMLLSTLCDKLSKNRRLRKDELELLEAAGYDH